MLPEHLVCGEAPENAAVLVPIGTRLGCILLLSGWVKVEVYHVQTYSRDSHTWFSERR